MHLPKKEMTKTKKKIKQMGLVIEVNIFVNVYEWLRAWLMCDGWFVSVIYQSAQCFFFFFFSFVAYQDVWNIRGHFCLFCSNGNFVFSCLESLCERECVCVSLLQTGTWSVCFESEWVNEWERERERAIAQHILSLTSSSSPYRRNRNAYICKC